MLSLGDFITICHTNKIIGRYISDKAHSKSLCKGQGHSKYTLYVNQSFNPYRIAVDTAKVVDTAIVLQFY
jgi:hypothetical protein